MKPSVIIATFLVGASPLFGEGLEHSSPDLVESLEWRIGLPVWAGIPSSGNVAAGGVVTNADMSMSGIIDHIDMAGALSLEVRSGPWVFLADGMYLKLSDSVDPVFPLFKAARLEVEQTLANAAVGYRFVNREVVQLDGLAGLRYNKAGLVLDLDGVPPFLADRHIDVSRDWVDPVAALQLRVKLCRPVTLVAKGDVGGFDVGSDISWQLYGGLEFKLADWLWSGLGWRHLCTDYRDGNFVYNVSTAGPVVELGLSF